MAWEPNHPGRITPPMSDTKKKALGGMSTFVVSIFVLAVIIAGIYFFVIPPGQP